MYPTHPTPISEATDNKWKVIKHVLHPNFRQSLGRKLLEVLSVAVLPIERLLINGFSAFKIENCVEKSITHTNILHLFPFLILKSIFLYSFHEFLEKRMN